MGINDKQSWIMLIEDNILIIIGNIVSGYLREKIIAKRTLISRRICKIKYVHEKKKFRSNYFVSYTLFYIWKKI